MRHLTISTALLAGCLIAGAAWAQGSSGGSGGGSWAVQAEEHRRFQQQLAILDVVVRVRRLECLPKQMRPSARLPRACGEAPIRGTGQSRTGGSTGNTPAGNSTTSGPIPPSGTEGSSGSTSPATTGTVAGDSPATG